ncbi:MAG TPA: hypothetical protein VFO40_16715 [Chthoniobacterales bacterium]|nr:hypothetical protein [Chthoniobacterales bacterium]
MNSVIHKISHHTLGSCACCGTYRLLKYEDAELGILCDECAEYAMAADIELNFGGYELRRPEVTKQN